MHDVMPGMSAIQADVSVLDALADAIAVLSNEGEIVCSNAAWRRLTERPDNALSGAGVGVNLLAVCEARSEQADLSQAELAAGLRSVLAGRSPDFTLEYSTGTGKETSWYRFAARPRAGGGVVIQHSVITGLKSMKVRLQRERQVAASAHEALCEAVDSMSEGFALYDREGRLMFCNDHYESFYRPVAHMIRSGVMFKDLAAAAAAAGLFPDAVGREEEWLRDRLDLQKSSRAEIEYRLADDRWVRSRTRRTAGGARVAMLTDVSKLKHREARLQASEARFRHFAAAGSERLWEIDRDLRFSYYSVPRDDESGVLSDRILGTRLWEILQWEGSADERWRAHRDDLEAHVPFRNFRFSKPIGGQIRHFRTSGVPVLDEAGDFCGYRGTLTDETEEIEARLRAERAEAHLRAAVETLPYGFVIRDSEDRLLLCNATYKQMYKLTDELAAPGASFEATLRAGLAHGLYLDAIGREEEWLAERLHALREPRGPFEQKLLDRWILVEEKRLPDGGTVGMRTDVTEIKRGAQRAVQSERLQALGTLAGGIAHDFNNLLAAMIGYAELALDEPQLSPDACDSLEHVLSAGQKAKDLVKQILRFSRFTDDGAAEPCQVATIAEEVIAILRPAIHPDVRLALDVRSREVDVLAIPAHLSQIVMNLTVNAAQAIGQRPGRVDVIVDEVEVDEVFAELHPPLARGRCVRLTVRDDGPGMNEALVRRVFEPFFTTKQVGEGTGMGLSVVHGIVGKYDGTITVYSEVGAGSEFRVFLPVSSAAVPDSRDCSPKGQLPAGRSGNAILVDDDPAVRGAGVGLLSRLGYCVVEFPDAQSALESLADHPEDFFSLVVTDHVMPGMSGQELAAAIRRSWPDLPILLCTGYGHGLDEARLAELGETALLVKPFTLRELATALDGLVGTVPEP